MICYSLIFVTIVLSIRLTYASKKSEKQECFGSYENDDHYKRFSEHLNRRNCTHYSPIMPSYNQALLKISESEIQNGKIVSCGNSSARIRNRALISPETSVNERSLCSFDYVLNYNRLRMPSTLIEANCTERHPPQKLIGKRMLECQPLQYKIRVLMFDENCNSFKEQEETIALACIPVLQKLYWLPLKNKDFESLLAPWKRSPIVSYAKRDACPKEIITYTEEGSVKIECPDPDPYDIQDQSEPYRGEGKEKNK